MNGILSSPAAAIVASRAAGCLVGEPWWTTRSGLRRLEHQALRGGDLAHPCEVVAAQDAEVRVRQQPALERALAAPHDVGDEVLEAELRELRLDAGMLVGSLAGEDEQLLDAAPRRRGRAAARPRRARAGAAGASRTRSTCSSSGRSATARG